MTIRDAQERFRVSLVQMLVGPTSQQNAVHLVDCLFGKANGGHDEVAEKLLVITGDYVSNMLDAVEDERNEK